MSRKVTAKRIKIHKRIGNAHFVEDRISVISCKTLRQLCAKRRIYRDTKEVFYFLEVDYDLIL